jgi:hypothetical protein
LIGANHFEIANDFVLHGLIGHPFTSPCIILFWNNNNLGELHGLHGLFHSPAFNSVNVLVRLLRYFQTTSVFVSSIARASRSSRASHMFQRFQLHGLCTTTRANPKAENGNRGNCELKRVDDKGNSIISGYEPFPVRPHLAGIRAMSNITKLFPGVELPPRPRKDIEKKVRLDGDEAWAVQQEARELKVSEAQVLRAPLRELVAKHYKRSMA